MIRIGYAGINTLLPSANRTFRLAGYSEAKMLEVAHANLLALERILKWNQEHDITLFRITSQLIPFGSHPINSGVWKTTLTGIFERIGRLVRESRMRVSMHPGQFTVLNTPNEHYYFNSLQDLEYHNSVLSLMGLDSSHKIILHGGGAYGDKSHSSTLLIERVLSLPGDIRGRLVLENDDRIFNAEDILSICLRTAQPAVFDCFHHAVLPSFQGMSDKEIINLFRNTWGAERQKIHYSNQEPGKQKGAHSNTIDVEKFRGFYDSIRSLDMDVMLEVKDKQVSVLKLQAAISDLK